ncbi:MAG: TolC family protein [Telluria sp.]|nr:TolC family protein [Telluria sp.]
MRLLLFPIGLALLWVQPLLAAAQSSAPLHSAINADAVPLGTAPLTLDAAIRRAFQSNPGLRAAGRELDIAAGQRAQAGAIPNPELSYLSEGLKQNARTTTVQINQAIELGGKRGARIAFAEREREIASADLASYRSALRADVVTAFFEVLTAQERLLLAQASQELSQKVTVAASRRVIAGKISPVEETRARVAEASTNIELSQAANDLALAKRRLAATWGSAEPIEGSVEAPALPVGAHPSTAELLSHLPLSPQIVRARSEIERQAAMADLERSRRFPDLTLSLGSKRDEQIGNRQTVVGLAVPFPLFDRNQGNVLSAMRRTDKARDELLAVQNKLSVELAQASLRLNAAVSELDILRNEILPGAQSAYEAGTKGFELGKFSFLDVLDAQRTLFQAKTQYVRAIAESHRAAADIERIVGNVEQHGRLTPSQPQNKETQ